MKKHTLLNKVKLVLLMLIISSALCAQIANGKENIEKLCGCFEVSFKYAETFSPNSEYKFHEREEINGAIELALPIEATDNKISIQHLLIVSDDIVVKHWREDWSFENPQIWKYVNTKTWQKEQNNVSKVKGKWTQTVWEVSDEPRYQGYSKFIEIDGKTIWQNTTDAPLPRREYTKRSDYNILNRTNKIIITDSGYVHEQDNRKVIRNNGKDTLLVEEKGFNIYKKIDNSKCDAAKKYWLENSGYWGKVEKIWTKYIETHDKIKLASKVEGKVLNQYLSEILEKYATKISDEEIENKISEIVYKFMES